MDDRLMKADGMASLFRHPHFRNLCNRYVRRLDSLRFQAHSR